MAALPFHTEQMSAMHNYRGSLISPSGRKTYFDKEKLFYTNGDIDPSHVRRVYKTHDK